MRQNLFIGSFVSASQSHYEIYYARPANGEEKRETIDRVTLRGFFFYFLIKFKKNQKGTIDGPHG